MLVSFFNEGLGEAGFALDPMEIEAVRVGHPIGIYLVVLAWSDSIDLILAAVDRDVCTGCAIGIDRLGLLHEPDPHLESEIVRGQSTYWTDVHGVERVIVREFFAGIDGEDGVAAPVGKPEHRIIGNLIGEANASAAHDATLVVESNPGSNIDILRLFHLLLAKTRLAVPVLHAEFLERTFAGLVADGAVERVVRKKEFHDSLAAFLGHFALGADSHVRSDRVRTSDRWTRDPRDGKVAVFIRLGRIFPRSRPGRHSHLDETHPAVTGRRQLRVIAVMRHFDVNLATGFDHAGPLGEGVPFPIDLDVD